jgi:hypothetical protein
MCQLAEVYRCPNARNPIVLANEKAAVPLANSIDATQRFTSEVSKKEQSTRDNTDSASRRQTRANEETST